METQYSLNGATGLLYSASSDHVNFSISLQVRHLETSAEETLFFISQHDIIYQNLFCTFLYRKYLNINLSLRVISREISSLGSRTVGKRHFTTAELPGKLNIISKHISARHQEIHWSSEFFELTFWTNKSAWQK